MRWRVLTVLGLVGPLMACTPYFAVTSEDLRTAGNEELCGRRGNLLTGGLIQRELAWRGETCAAYDASDEDRPWFDPAGLFASRREPSPPVAYGALETTPSVTLDPPPPPPPAAYLSPPWAATGADPQPPPPSADLSPAAVPAPAAPPPPAADRPAAAAAAVAPLVSPGCAERTILRGAGEETRRRAVSFRNRCDFPIRVRYAARSDGRLTEVSPRLGPGETSPPARIEDGFDFPGYAVCSYRSAPESALCR